jgi:hypothetical protein
MLRCMRTTIDLNDELLDRAKRQAIRERTTLKAIVERALRSHLSGRPTAGSYRLRWRTERGRLQPGVRLEDRDALFDLMEGRP